MVPARPAAGATRHAATHTARRASVPAADIEIRSSRAGRGVARAQIAQATKKPIVSNSDEDERASSALGPGAMVNAPTSLEPPVQGRSVPGDATELGKPFACSQLATATTLMFGRMRNAMPGM